MTGQKKLQLRDQHQYKKKKNDKYIYTNIGVIVEEWSFAIVETERNYIHK